MLAGDLDRRLGSPVCHIKLASDNVQISGPYQGKREAAGVCKPLGEGEAGFDLLQGTVGKAEIPKSPRRIQPARDTCALRVEQKVGRILPGRDRIVDRDAFVYRRRGIGKPAKEEQRCPAERAGPGARRVSSCSSASATSCVGEIIGTLVLPAHEVAAPQPSQRRKQLG